MALFNGLAEVLFTGKVCDNITLSDVGETQVINFGIRIPAGYKKGNEWVDQSYFLTIEAWGKLASLLNDKLSPGMFVSGTGNLQIKSGKDGKNYTSVRVNNTITILNNIGGSDEAESAPRQGKAIRVKESDDIDLGIPGA